MDQITNPELIRRLKNGEEKAYMFLLDKYYRRLYAYSITLIDNHAAAQDIVQNVFLNTWRSREKLNENFAMENFLFKSVYNEFVNIYKKDKSVMLLQMKYYEAMSEVVENTNETNLEKMIELVTREIDKLPPKCKQIFTLSKKDGLTNIEISEYLNISIKTVEAHITKAFSLLRERLGGQYNSILFMIFGKSLKAPDGIGLS